MSVELGAVDMGSDIRFLLFDNYLGDMAVMTFLGAVVVHVLHEVMWSSCGGRNSSSTAARCT